MIIESQEWKQAIKRNVRYIKTKISTDLPDIDDGIYDRLQIKVVTNALLCRRLLETPKVSSKLKTVKMRVISYPWSGENVNIFNHHSTDKQYQLNNPFPKSVLAPVLCNQLIHSFVWLWGFDENEILSSFLVNSDKTKHKKLYEVKLIDFLEYCLEIANSWPSSLQYYIDEKTKEYIYIAE